MIDLYPAESEGDAISVTGVIPVGVAVVVDITEVSGVAGIRRTLPPVVGRTGAAQTTAHDNRDET